MPDTATAASATPNAADAAVKASADAAKAAADKIANDKIVADAAAAAQTPEQKAAADKAAADAQAAADKANAERKYDLKVPEGSKLDAAFMERTTAIARELGLDQKGAEKLLAQRAKEATDALASREQLIADWKPGGKEWEKRDQTWSAAALADPDLGAGDKGKLDIATEKVHQALTKFGDDELREDLKVSGWGSKPSVLRLLARIGRAMGEGEQIKGSSAGSTAKKSDAQIMFPNMYNDDGSPKT